MVADLVTITGELAQRALSQLNIDKAGLDQLDRAILASICDKYDGGPVGIETVSVTLGEERSTIEDVYEPFLVHKGFLVRTPRGRMITDLGRQLLIR
jgi:Holliday junction DNA helicase RuvB